MKKLGIGIIGCGNISTSYLRLAPLFKGLEVRAVADLNMEAAKARATEYNTKAQSVDDLLANPDLDIVINLTIPEAHYPITKRILEAGKSAYSEKPLVLTLEQGKTLRDLAKSKGLSVGCAPDTFLGGAHQQARAILDEGVVLPENSSVGFDAEADRALGRVVTESGITVVSSPLRRT